MLNAIKYLAKFGFTEEQVYLLLSCCPCEGRISGIVDVPNAVATLAVPLAIFDRDVRPTGDALSNAVWKSPENSRHRADAITGTMSRRWRGAPEI